MQVVRRLVLASILLALTAAPAGAAPARGDLWATINVCDTREHPDTIGIRGSMPGLGTRPSRLFMRFRVQYLAKPDNTWRDVVQDADSGWLRLGRSTRRVVESGQNFQFLPPSGGGVHRLRGLVTYKWVARRSSRVLLRARRVTTSGHRSTAGADPAGYSAAICDIS
jgi:hypothetical protein